MKKILLSALALVATLSVNAQEYAAFNADENAEFAALGLSSDATSVNGGSVIGKTSNVTFMIGADDSYKSSSIGTITVGDAKINGGIQGGTNPKDADGGVPATTLVAPAGGAFYLVEVAEDGFLYVLQNSSSNKAYTVFEEGEAIGYTFSAYWGKEKYPAGKGVYGYELKGGGEYNQLKAAGITSVLWPEQYIMGDAYDIANTPDSKGYGDGGLGIIKFPVFAGCKYIVNANGSKMTASGFYFDKKGDATITIKVDDADVTILDKGQIPGSSVDPVNPEYAAFNADENAEFAALGLSSDATSVDGGTVIGKTENITFMIGADDSYKSSSIGTITVGDVQINGGIQGSTNPKDADGGVPATTLVAPAGGAFYLVEVAEDGFLYVLQNSSSNKAYTVFEEGEAIGYTFSAYWGKEKFPGGKKVYGYELKGGGEYNQLKAAGITSVLWPEQYIMGDAYDIANTPDSKGYGDGGLGVIKFPVFAGCKYIVNANGSKITASGFYFDKKGDATITTKVDDADVTILDKGQIPGGSDDPVIPVTKGDANGDGTVNAADIVEIVNYIMGSASNNFNEAAADANGDGVVNAADIVAVVNIIMGI